MNALWTFLVTGLAAYLIIGVIGFFAKIYYLLFMFGWNLI